MTIQAQTIDSRARRMMLRMIRRITLAAGVLLTSLDSLAVGDAERFDIDRFQIEGNTLLKNDEIELAVQPFTGKGRAYGDVQQALEVLRQRYVASGYSVVWVVAPEQDLDQGFVTLRVIEGRLGKVSVEGNRHFDDANIRASLPALWESMSPRAADISANSQLGNENPSKQVDVVLRPGQEEGVVDAVVDVIDVAPLKAFMTFDNTGNRQTGEYRLGVGVQHANLWNRDHVGTISYVTSPEKANQVKLYSGSYRLPLYSLGDSMDFIAAYSDVSAGTTPTVAGPLTFSGQGTVYGVRYNQLLKRRGEYSQRIVYGLDYRAYENSCSLGSFGAAGCGPAAVPVTVRPVSVAYSGNATQPGRVSDFYIALSRNLPGAAKGRESDFIAVRPASIGDTGAPSHYTILRFGASTVGAFESNWQIRAALSAQYSPDALVAGEQFGVAGATAVRGFLEREIARDTGYFANLELYSPNLVGTQVPGEGNLRGLLFYDMAMAANNRLPGDLRQKVSIASVGAGLRWNIQRNFNVRFDLARVVDAGGSKHSGDLRGHVSVYFGF